MYRSDSVRLHILHGEYFTPCVCTPFEFTLANDRYFPPPLDRMQTPLFLRIFHTPFSLPPHSIIYPLGTCAPGRAKAKSFPQFPHMFGWYQRSRWKDLQVKWHKRTLGEDILRLSLSFIWKLRNLQGDGGLLENRRHSFF